MTVSYNTMKTEEISISDKIYETQKGNPTSIGKGAVCEQHGFIGR